MMFYPEKASKIMQGRLEKMNTDDRGGEGGGGGGDYADDKSLSSRGILCVARSLFAPI